MATAAAAGLAVPTAASAAQLVILGILVAGIWAGTRTGFYRCMPVTEQPSEHVCVALSKPYVSAALPSSAKECTMCVHQLCKQNTGSHCA